MDSLMKLKPEILRTGYVLDSSLGQVWWHTSVILDKNKMEMGGHSSSSAQEKIVRKSLS
jgi:hypothetical protein